MINSGGNTHYRLNWDTDNMASMAAIGILCDNRAVYQQAVDYFKFGPGNSRVERYDALVLSPGARLFARCTNGGELFSICVFFIFSFLCNAISIMDIFYSKQRFLFSAFMFPGDGVP